MINVPDALSRAPLSPAGGVVLGVQSSNNGKSESFQLFPFSDMDIWEAQVKDPECQMIFQKLLTEMKESEMKSEPAVSFIILEDKVYRRVWNLVPDLYSPTVKKSCSSDL